jgi:hypothetical protein
VDSLSFKQKQQFLPSPRDWVRTPAKII